MGNDQESLNPQNGVHAHPESLDGAPTHDAHGTSASSGIKVLDRAVLILTTVAAHPHSLAELCTATALPRATAHRLATALEVHHLLSRTTDGRWTIGSALASLSAGSSDRLIDAATPLLSDLVERSGESVQLYRLTGTSRTCVAAQEPPSGLQNTVPVGSRMPLTAGSAARVFMAYAPDPLRQSILPQAAFNQDDLNQVKEQGFASSISEREAGLASISVPVFSSGTVIAALSISGPAERMIPHLQDYTWPMLLKQAAAQLSASL